MAGRSNTRGSRERDSDSLEVLKPLIVLGLFGTILYGAYSVVQKGPGQPTPSVLGEAPPFAAPEVQFSGPSTENVFAPPLAAAPAQPPTVEAPSSFPPPPPTSAYAVAAPQEANPGPPPPAPPAAMTASMPPSVPPGMPPAIPPASEVLTEPMPAAGPVADMVIAGGEPASLAADPSATFLPAEAASPPVGVPPERQASLPVPQPPPSALPARTQVPAVSPDPTLPMAASAAFSTAWSDAQLKLAGGRYAEALASLSTWYDDPSLGLEESQRLEDLLGQLAGTVIYSQQDLLLPPHVVGPGETLPTIAASLAVPWQLLAKINGVADPMQLYPGERIKLVRGPFDAAVSVSRRRLSLQLGGNYAGSFPVVVGRQFLDRVGGSLPVVEVQRDAWEPTAAVGPGPRRLAILLGDGMTVEAAVDPASMADTAPSTTLVVSPRELDELIDMLGPGSRLFVRE